ncbi:MAG TPA: MBL fold metallo-hydrolase, partial [Acidilobales archaeon]|nr:MBL fold metallo-hydrolase [Acidilobales archaeon]
MNKVAKLIVLGSSAGIPQKERGLSSIALDIVGKGVLLMDAGEGTQIMFNKAGLSLAKLNVVLITHLHGDHVFGLPGIIQTRSMMGVKKELIVIGPGGIKEFISRVNELTRFKPGYRLNIIEAPIELDLGYVTIKTFKTEHIVPSFGYVVNIHSRERNV